MYQQVAQDNVLEFRRWNLIACDGRRCRMVLEDLTRGLIQSGGQSAEPVWALRGLPTRDGGGNQARGAGAPMPGRPWIVVLRKFEREICRRLWIDSEPRE